MADGYATPSIESDPRQPAETPAPDLERLKRMFTEAQTLTQDARTEAATDQDYYDHKQWTSGEKKALAKRGQPDIVINRIQVAVNGIVGVSERSKSEPRAFPRTPQDEDSADVVTDVLRYIADHNRFHRIKQDCFTDKLISGTMAALIGVDADKQVEVVQIRFEEFFYDPRSRRRDFRDARYLGIAKWMYRDDVTGLYPDKASDIGLCVETGVGNPDGNFQDRPNGATNLWADKRSSRLLVVELYYREAGQWMRCVYCGTALLESGPSPYLDEKKRPVCPIEAQSAFVDRTNARYGAVRGMRGPQDEINKRRSKLLHLVSSSQVQARDIATVGDNIDAVRAEAAKPDGVIPYGWEKVQTTDMAAGQASLLAEAKSEIERMGPNPAVLGRGGEDQSGRAVLARQQAGLVELALLYGGLEDWELRVYRQCWARAKQFWDAPMYIRVTDDENAPKFVGLNGAPPVGQASQPGQPPQMGAPQPQEPAPGPGGLPQAIQPAAQPMGQPQPAPANNLAQMDVDIVLDTTPDTGTVAQEQFQDIVQLVGSNPIYAQQVPFKVLLKLSSIPHKRQILDALDQAAQENAQQQANAQQIAQAAAVAKVKDLEANTGLTQAKTQTELTKPHLEAVSMYQDAILHPAVTPPPGDPSQGTGAPESMPPQGQAGPPPIG